MVAKKKTAAKKSAKVKESTGDLYDILGSNDSGQGAKEYLSTGIMTLNNALSGKYENGGFAVGRIHELFGGESSGKTMIATLVMAEAQRRGGIAFFSDFEHSFDITQGKRLGLTDDPSQWHYKQPGSAEECFKMIEDVAKIASEKFPEKHICGVIDSIAAMETVMMQEGDFALKMNENMSLPKLMSNALRRLSKAISSCNMTLILLNQTRDKIGVTFGSKIALPGGNATKFYASTRTHIIKTGKIGKEENVTGENIKFKVIKNKVYIPFKIAKYRTLYDEKTGGVHVDLFGTHFDDLCDKGIINKDSEFISKGAPWYKLDGESYQGEEKFLEAFNKTPDAYKKMLDMYKLI